MFMQAIFVMLVAMSKFLHSKLDNPAPPWPAIANTTTVTPSAVHLHSPTYVEFQELIRNSRILSSQWVTWFTVAVWERVLEGWTLPRDIVTT
jgi:hypothetical protein